MRILQLCPTMHRAGTWFRCFYLSRALARRGHDVTLVKISPNSRLNTVRSEEDGVHVVETPRFVGARVSHHNTRLPSDLLARCALVLREPFDVVHTFSHHLNAMLPGLLSRHVFRGGALIADWDDLWTDGGIYGASPERGVFARLNYAFDSWCETNLKRYADAVTVVSDDLRRRAVAHGVPSGNIAFVPNGAPIDVVCPVPRKPVRQELDLPDDRPILIFAGFGQYDIDLVLDAAQVLRERGTRALTVITGPHDRFVLEEVRARGLEQEVRVAGMLSFETLCKYLVASDVGLIPYADKPLNRARWPIKLGDYLAAGLPIATCDVGEMGRIVREWNVGVASHPEPQAFADGIERLVGAADTEAVRRAARQAAERISWDALGGDLEKVYWSAIDRARPVSARG